MPLRPLKSSIVIVLLFGSSTRALAAPPSDATPQGDATPACKPDEGPCESPPPQPATALEWYARGMELGSAGNYADAAAAFLRSYELQSTPEALFNAAFAYEKAGVVLSAIDTYERFLAEPQPTQQYVEPARRSIDVLGRQVGVLKGLRYDPERPPAQLFVQGEPIELDAFPLRVMPGNIEIEVVDGQGRRAHEFYELSAGEALLVDVRALLPGPVEAPSEEPRPPVEDTTNADIEAAQAHAQRARALRKVTWIGVGLTGSSALAAVTFGALALREQRLFEEQSCTQFEGMNCPLDWTVGEPKRHWDLYRSHTIAGTALASVSGALALGTLVVGLVSVRHQRASRLSNVGHGRARVRLQPAIGGLLLRF